MISDKHPLTQRNNRCRSNGIICGIVEGFYGRPWTNEQRKDLFERMRVMGLNTYLYAPKDDLKHRFEWRTLYNDEEADLLRSLIQSAKNNKVHFVYSISPGIDIVYSQETEVKAIIRKLKQVEELGCTSFALLFDDIEVTMNEADAKAFPSFVAAQITITNQVYVFMNADMFLFCPTEYCSTRAIPDVKSSSYLNTLGRDLAEGIEIMWTGPQVVSPELTPIHAEEIAGVLRRKPLIWDNYHANDYDPKRIFLGPFAGRSVSLKQHISGLLLNPNCKFEANFVPLYTLSVWNQCSPGRVGSDEEMTEMYSKGTSYEPLKALDKALDKWVDLYFRGPGPAIPPISQAECTLAPTTPTVSEPTSFAPPLIRTCEANDLVSSINGSVPPLYTSASGNATTLTVQAYPIEESPEDKEMADEALLTANSLSTSYRETMTKPNRNNQTDICSTVESVEMEEISGNTDAKITRDQLALLVDIFYLPFDYGKQGLEMLEDFQFMHKNCHILRQNREMDADIVFEWNCRFENFQSKASRLELFFRHFLNAPNRSLVQELLAYVSEAHATVSTLSAILTWMRAGNLLVMPSHNVDNWWRNRLVNVEPWSFGNGLLPDLQKLVICSPEVANLFLYKNLASSFTSSYRIEPLINADDLDAALIYDIFAYPEEKALLEKVSPSAAANIFFDRCFGLHLKNSRPKHHFQIKEIDPCGKHQQLFAIMTSIFSLQASMQMIKAEFVSKYRESYIEMLSDNKTGEEMFLKDLDTWPIFQLPDSFITKYPSFFEIRWRLHAPEAAICRRLFNCVASTLTMNGSSGLFTVVPTGDEERINLLCRLGLNAMNDVINGYVVLARLL